MSPARLRGDLEEGDVSARADRRARGAHTVAALIALVAGGAGGACGDDGLDDTGDFAWELPRGFPVPAVPRDNPMSVAKVELGRHLFYDRRLSINNTMSCASCHLPEQAFADGKRVPEGATGTLLLRNSPGLQNVAYLSTYTWGNPVLETLEQQVVVPLFGDNPIELGTGEDLAGILARLAADPVYPALFSEAFPGQVEPISRAAIIYAVASFTRSMISGDSPYDRYAYGKDSAALSDSAKRGMELFFSERAECYHCHSGVNLTNAFRARDSASIERVFENNGLYNVGNAGTYPANNPGLYEFTGKPEDHGKFRVPPLRNLSFTAPYMHDGSVATLEELVDMYARGGRRITEGPLAGDGALNPHKSSLVRGFNLSAQDRADLLAWLRSLDDPGFGANPRFADPWVAR